MNLEQIIKDHQGTILDVRSYNEFTGGNAKGSINIPLSEVPQRIDEIKQLPSPLILCCASGGRSGQAQRFLAQQGIECYNAGSWLDVNFLQTK